MFVGDHVNYDLSETKGEKWTIPSNVAQNICPVVVHHCDGNQHEEATRDVDTMYIAWALGSQRKIAKHLS